MAQGQIYRYGRGVKYWLFLLAAILLEVAGTTLMKMSDGLTKVVPSVLMFLLYLMSLAALTLALKKFDMSMAYAIWSGLGTVLIALIGIYFFKESVNMVKITSIFLIIIGVVGLHLSSKSI